MTQGGFYCPFAMNVPFAGWFMAFVLGKVKKKGEVQ